ncbi:MULTISPECIES: magnesium transporter CorA family protein [Acinetobacter]|uniref:magnesium transporter CorA family protein n=1 Tax=Acinetobacter TaxID=469 RepID=UPI0010206B07|nr:MULTISPECIES: magnesium transporter CorA family protein [Acinetobacter]MDM1758934.1 magnesium transporter CorA family protein [Acinetobacter sp. 256-1]MDM1760818.1 magnesium transporter CorA family protein [Acinetobacter sp. 251-1]RYL25524.1 magnesium transporter [Acinetobacter piscicola]
MQTFYFFQPLEQSYICIQNQPVSLAEQQFIWIDCTREDVVNRSEDWQKEIFELTGIHLNEYHIRDILNLEHPCAFDAMEDYDLLIFRKLITPDDHILSGEAAVEQHESVFGLTSSPISFVITPHVLVSIHEKGNYAFESYLNRIMNIMTKDFEEQNKPRKLPATPLDLALRLLNSMIDGYLDLRKPLTRRVEYWQQDLLQGNRRFSKWHQLFQEMMVFQQIENLCEEQMDALQELRDEIVDNYSHFKGKKKSDKQDLMLVRVDDLSSHVERIQKYTSRLSSAIQAAINLHFSAISNQTNENMRILAIITAVFAPLTLLTGVYGMNFEFIPGLKSPIGFWLMLSAMLICTVALLIYFYRRHLVGRGERSVIDMLAQQHKNQHVNLLWFLDYEPIKQTMKEVEKITKLK